jgi:pimeloyl-ACP methyl ester carboxylesterase
MLVAANQTVLEYDVFGNPSHEALLLISGLNTPMTRWSVQFCTLLAEYGYFVIRYNHRDTGHSKHYSEKKSWGVLFVMMARVLGFKLKLPYTIDDMVKDGVALLDKLHIDKAHIVGKSMGGVIAQLIASRYPERVHSLTVMMSTTGKFSLPGPSRRIMWLILKKKPHPNMDLPGYLQHRLEYTKSIGSKKFALSEQAIRERVLDDLQGNRYNPGAAKRQLAALIQAGDIRPSIKKITCPTLVIHGDSDPLVPLACGLDVHANIAHSTLKIVKDMGHSLHEQFIEEIITAIRMMKLENAVHQDQSEVLAVQNACVT